MYTTPHHTGQIEEIRNLYGKHLTESLWRERCSSEQQATEHLYNNQFLFFHGSSTAGFVVWMAKSQITWSKSLWLDKSTNNTFYPFFSFPMRWKIQIFVDNDSEKLGKPFNNLDVDKRNKRNRGIISWLQQLGIQRLDWYLLELI